MSEFRFEIQDDTHICEDCPGRRALADYAQAALEADIPEAERALAMADLGEAADRLNQAARMIGCQSIEKELPPDDVEVPPAGTPERIIFAKTCPAYKTYKQLQSATSN